MWGPRMIQFSVQLVLQCTGVQDVCMHKACAYVTAIPHLATLLHQRRPSPQSVPTNETLRRRSKLQQCHDCNCMAQTLGPTMHGNIR